MGVKSTKNNYFLLLSDDDILYPATLKPSLFEQLPKRGIYSFSCIYRNVKRPYGWKMPPKKDIIDCIKECPKLCASVISKDAFYKAGQWNQKRFGFYYDWVTILKIVKQFGIYPINRKLGVYNTHGENVSELHKEEYNKYNKIINEYFKNSTEFENEYPHICKKMSNYINIINRDRNASMKFRRLKNIGTIYRLRFF